MHMKRCVSLFNKIKWYTSACLLTKFLLCKSICTSMQMVKIARTQSMVAIFFNDKNSFDSTNKWWTICRCFCQLYLFKQIVWKNRINEITANGIFILIQYLHAFLAILLENACNLLKNVFWVQIERGQMR